MEKQMNYKGESLGNDYWQEHQDKWVRSGLSQAKYCEQEGIKFSSFCYWRTRILSEEAPKPTLRFSTLESPKTLDKPHVTPSIQMAFPNGLRIGIDNNVDTSLLKQVLSFVREL